MFPSYGSSKDKNPSLSADLHIASFTLRCSLLIPLMINNYVFQEIIIFPRWVCFKAFAKCLQREKLVSVFELPKKLNEESTVRWKSIQKDGMLST